MPKIAPITQQRQQSGSKFNCLKGFCRQNVRGQTTETKTTTCQTSSDDAFTQKSTSEQTLAQTFPATSRTHCRVRFVMFFQIEAHPYLHAGLEAV